QANTRRRVAHLGNPRIDFVARQLSTFTRFSALSHLDLQLLGMDQVFAGYAEPGRGNLFDGAVARVTIGVRDVTGRIFATFAGVALAADAIHGDGQRLMRLLAD